MRPPTPTMAELLKIAEMYLAQRKKAAEKLPTECVMTRQELIK